MTIQSWREVDGDNTLALDWPINENSLVWEIGGYEGRWVAQMAEKFNPFIEIFEPQSWAVEKMRERFKENPKITIHPYGLWVEDAWLRMGDYFTDGASVMKPPEGDHLVEFRDVVVLLLKRGAPRLTQANVCLMNIEGAEFTLLPYMLKEGLMSAFQYFWCQFHDFADPDGKLTDFIFTGLEETHDILWNHYPTAVAWKRREQDAN